MSMFTKSLDIRRGRLSRTSYYSSMGLILGLSIMFYFLMISGLPLLIAIPIQFFFCYVSYVLIARRLRDFSYSGWYAAFFGIPQLFYCLMPAYGSQLGILMLIMLLAVGAVPGSVGDNKYGSEP